MHACACAYMCVHAGWRCEWVGVCELLKGGCQVVVVRGEGWEWGTTTCECCLAPEGDKSIIDIVNDHSDLW